MQVDTYGKYIMNWEKVEVRNSYDYILKLWAHFFFVTAYMEPDEEPLKTRSKRSATVSKREAPYVIYPEILVIVDYDGYRLVTLNWIQ